jgi:hypothetical protein
LVKIDIVDACRHGAAGTRGGAGPLLAPNARVLDLNLGREVPVQVESLRENPARPA